MMNKSFIIIGFACSLLAACGEGSIVIDGSTFEPKIVIQGTLFPNQPVNIRLMRNYPLGTTVDFDHLILTDAEAAIVDGSGRTFGLRLNPETEFYEYSGSDLQIVYGRTYTLEVSATIDGKELSAQSTTTMPQQGFRVLEDKSVLGPMRYRERDSNGDLIDFQVTFERSPETDFYAVSINALDAAISTFIYENPFGDFNEDDVEKDFNDFKYAFNWIQETPSGSGESTIEIFSFFTWFIGNYRAVVYAADRNFKDFLITHEEVQEIDGNFHEPALHIVGDGIGVFGSAIADTVHFTILPN
ncbi:DUF4249 domain-containing protein [bacterium]|nr:DUF4249 domain-containing protein [bacterium]